MSYKVDLQSNNTDLQVILDSINALTESGSGSKESCNLGLKYVAAGGGLSVYYIDIDGMPQSKNIMDLSDNLTLDTDYYVTATKNSLVVINSTTASFQTVAGVGSYKVLVEGCIPSTATAVVFLTGDASFYACHYGTLTMEDGAIFLYRPTSTWAEFIQSTHNDGDFTAYEEYNMVKYTNSDGTFLVLDGTGNDVLLTDIIDPDNVQYTLSAF